jgi:hypothetical protein
VVVLFLVELFLVDCCFYFFMSTLHVVANVFCRYCCISSWSIPYFVVCRNADTLVDCCFLAVFVVALHSTDIKIKCRSGTH